MTSTSFASNLPKSSASSVGNVFWHVNGTCSQQEAGDTAGHMLIDPTHPNHHVAECFLACDIVDYGDVLCASVSIEHVRRDLELTTVVFNTVAIISTPSVKNSSACMWRSISLTIIVLAMFELSHTLLLTSSGGHSGQTSSMWVLTRSRSSLRHSVSLGAISSLLTVE